MARPKKVLIAEDEPGIRSVLVEFLSEWGCEILECGDGAKALELALAEKPDLILMDNGLPFLTGLEVARRLKQDVRTTSSTIVMVTAEPEPTPTPRNTLTRHYDGWIMKPFELEAFGQRVLAIFNAKTAGR